MATDAQIAAGIASGARCPECRAYWAWCTGHGRSPQRVTPTRYTVSRLPDDTSDYSTWSVQVEASGNGRWAVRNGGRCLNKDGEWEYEPLPSSRSAEWLDTVRWDDLTEAIQSAQAAEPLLRWNGLTPADVLARRSQVGADGVG